MAWFLANPSSVTVPALLMIMNIISFASMGLDKYYAVNRKSRISEKTLFLIALPFAALGAIIGMRMFRHKTKHNKFIFGMPALLILQIVIAYIAYLLFF